MPKLNINAGGERERERESVATPHPGSMIQHRDQSLRGPRRDSAQRSSTPCLSPSPDNRSNLSRTIGSSPIASSAVNPRRGTSETSAIVGVQGTISSRLRAYEIDRPSRLLTLVESCQEEDLSVFMDSLVIRVERTDHVLNHNFAI